MKGVNLARRPFVNRRPVARLAAVLWLSGFALLLVNVRLYGSHWRGKAINSERLARVNQEISEQRRQLRALDEELRRVNLNREEQRTAFLNSLIASRTFPWSALFDDLEDVLPLDVRLVSVKPTVQLKSDPGPGRRRAAQSRRARPASENSEPEASSEPLRRNEVALNLSAVAKSEDAMVELIERLYASSSFRAPYLPGELRNLDSGATSFSLSVVYLTRPAAAPGDEPEVAEGDPGLAAAAATAEQERRTPGPEAAADSLAVAVRTPGSPVPGSPVPGSPTPGSPTPGAPVPGSPAPASPAPGAAAPSAATATPDARPPGAAAAKSSTGRRPAASTSRPGSTIVGIGAAAPATTPPPGETPPGGTPPGGSVTRPDETATPRRRPERGPDTDRDEPTRGPTVVEPPASATPRVRRRSSGPAPALAASTSRQELAA